MSKFDEKTDFIYILWPGKTEADCIYEICQLGKFSYPKRQLSDGKFTRRFIFHKLQGFEILETIIAKDRMDILEHSKIISNRGKEYTVEEFLNNLDGVELK
jgi:hypothetical protein